MEIVERPAPPTGLNGSAGPALAHPRLTSREPLRSHAPGASASGHGKSGLRALECRQKALA